MNGATSNGGSGPFLPCACIERRGGEPVYCLTWARKRCLRGSIHKSTSAIGATVRASWRPVDLSVNSGGLLERLPSGIQDLVFGGSHRHGSTRSLHLLLSYTLREHRRIVNTSGAEASMLPKNRPRKWSLAISEARPLGDLCDEKWFVIRTIVGPQ